ncbi:Type 1 glutamine amidotransferase-like domain-containing protein [Cnuibacter physcomitrellae]|uniref:Type 1 glutamine amidotransferase-like domain-containing protein n=1 Tax=Cnuibacter physcomitrellae TaxID=1619308 RepID=UPI002175779E|nr:Type 1 glutamine amidotransferase-like domain-containing protein [Cnuibacter physcomitrellae]MCS5496312.1 Type 1 glutamine amidotransferase-like domain-containing protein [Cnuibacter physcomitrellae]
MTAAEPTIVATCAGLVGGEWTDLAYGPVMLHALSLARVEGRRPRVLHMNTAGGDPRGAEGPEIEAAWAAGAEARHLRLFPHPNTPDVCSFVLEHDLVWVSGGSVANLAALWRLHGVDRAMRAAWEAGVVLAGGSAGGVIWHEGGTTSSFGPSISAFTTGLGLVPGALAVHYDSDARRRESFHRSIVDGTLSGGFALEEGTGVVYRGAGPHPSVEAVTERAGARVRRVLLDDDGRAAEHDVPARLVVAPADATGPPGALPERPPVPPGTTTDTTPSRSRP